MKNKPSPAFCDVSLKHSARTLVLFSLLLASGCSNMGSKGSLFPSAGDAPIKIESEPSGAEVYVMGERLGVTPLDIRQRDVFPNIYPREKELVYGKVVLKKEGCVDLTKTVSSEISSVGLRAQLDCGGMKPAAPGTSVEVHRSGGTAEQRLEQIKSLLDKGLISEDEAKKARERVINDL